MKQREKYPQHCRYFLMEKYVKCIAKKNENTAGEASTKTSAFSALTKIPFINETKLENS